MSLTAKGFFLFLLFLYSYILFSRQIVEKFFPTSQNKERM
ncbi:hypothetical protein F544_20770 [Bibersteinia trehalosi USDA-ARS-USMARC-190]|uniref:Uncharacterized protein n=1 Tax=Bibersteinia trehalosi USDA-ARS-USMARC-190 TaxID=1263832 RepID=W0RAH1_BIBTR|nr:hypothetical protein F544_20770 [Bibersteinia trehalosi USDA-ARS-USMARC-190]